MKRFTWPLQRLLDVTGQRERAQRLEVFRLSQRMATVHGEIFRRRAAIIGVMATLRTKATEQRLAEQREFMLRLPVHEAEMKQLQQQFKALQDQRAEKVAALKKTRASRETLDRLREEALEAYTKQMLRDEQKELDETSQTAFARELIKQRVGDVD